MKYLDKLLSIPAEPILCEAETINQSDIADFPLSIFPAAVCQKTKYGEAYYFVIDHCAN